MTRENGRGFHFGLEAEFLLVDAETFLPLWHRDLTFREVNDVLESIPLDGLPALDGLELEAPHRKLMPFVVEGYHTPDPDFHPIDILPKGVEIRTPVSPSVESCLESMRVLYTRMQEALARRGYRAVTLSYHPTEDHFEGPQNKRRHDYWQWAMQVMLTYGPDINVSLPPDLTARLDIEDLSAKVNHYAPALTALSLASPLHKGGLWEIRGRVGKSVRTYRRSVVAPAIEVHLEEAGRLEFKTFDMPLRLEEFGCYLLTWLALLLDDGLKGRASNQTRVYDLGAVARRGLEAEAARERAAEVLDRAPGVLSSWGFDPAPLETFRRRLETNRLPADDIIELYRCHRSLPAVLRHLADATASEAVGAEDHQGRWREEPSFMRPFDRKEIPS